MSLCDIKASDNKDKPNFDFDFDSDVIYSDFKRLYKIDLSQEKMHWLDFKMLVNNLPEDSSTEKRRQLRQMKTKDVAKEFKSKLLQMQKAIEIPTHFTSEQKQATEMIKKFKGVRKCPK